MGTTFEFLQSIISLVIVLTGIGTIRIVRILTSRVHALETREKSRENVGINVIVRRNPCNDPKCGVCNRRGA